MSLAPGGNNRPFSVVGASWAAYSPVLTGDCCWQNDFSRPDSKFPDMDKLSNDIQQPGMRPGLWIRTGLWTRPLCTAHDTPADRLLPRIAGRNDPKKPVLDPTFSKNLAGIQRSFTTYRAWSYKLVKHDFSTYDLLGH